MILYYTGTGNSSYAARRIAAAIGDEAVDLFSRHLAHRISKALGHRNADLRMARSAHRARLA